MNAWLDEIVPAAVSGDSRPRLGLLRSRHLSSLRGVCSSNQRPTRMVDFHPARKWPIAASGRIRSQTILAIASIGTERIAPGIPHPEPEDER